MQLPSHIKVWDYNATAVVDYTPEVDALLRRTDKFGDEYTLIQSKGGLLATVPRGLVKREQSLQSKVTYNPCPQSIAVVPPRDDEQASVISLSVSHLKNGRDHIVEAPTGFGKTYVGASVAGHMGQVTLIVVTKNDLMVEWKNTLINLMGVDPKEIGHVQQKKEVYKGCRYVLAMIQSLTSREYDQDFYNHFGLVIFDEVHRLGAEHFSTVCTLFPSANRLGLSATPKRSDGREALFHAHIGPVLVTGTWIPMKPKVLVVRTNWKPPTWMKITPGQTMNLSKAICADHARNEEITKFIVTALEKGRRPVIMSDLLDDGLKVIFHHLVAKGIPGNDIGFYIGGMSQADIKSSIARKVVLATYAMCSEGTNVPHWDTLVMMTPRANIKQPVGRILRFVEGKMQPVVLDLVDDNALLKNYHLSRLKQYYELKAEIVNLQ